MSARIFKNREYFDIENTYDLIPLKPCISPKTTKTMNSDVAILPSFTLIENNNSFNLPETYDLKQPGYNSATPKIVITADKNTIKPIDKSLLINKTVDYVATKLISSIKYKPKDGIASNDIAIKITEIVMNELNSAIPSNHQFYSTIKKYDSEIDRYWKMKHPNKIHDSVSEHVNICLNKATELTDQDEFCSEIAHKLVEEITKENMPAGLKSNLKDIISRGIKSGINVKTGKRVSQKKIIMNIINKTKAVIKDEMNKAKSTPVPDKTLTKEADTIATKVVTEINKQIDTVPVINKDTLKDIIKTIPEIVKPVIASTTPTVLVGVSDNKAVGASAVPPAAKTVVTELVQKDTKNNAIVPNLISTIPVSKELNTAKSSNVSSIVTASTANLVPSTVSISPNKDIKSVTIITPSQIAVVKEKIKEKFNEDISLLVGEQFSDFTLSDIYEFLDSKGNVDPVLVNVATNAINKETKNVVSSTLPSGSVAQVAVNNAKPVTSTKPIATTNVLVKKNGITKMDNGSNKLTVGVKLNTPINSADKKVLAETLAPIITQNIIAQTLQSVETKVVINDKTSDVSVTVILPELTDIKVTNDITKNIKNIVGTTVNKIKNKKGCTLTGAIILIALILGLNHKFK